MFKGMFGGGAEVATTLHTSRVHPGGVVQGVIDITGGHSSVDVNFVEVSLVARVEVESGDSEYDAMMAVHHHRVAGAFRLQERGRHQIPLQLQIPWETPFNELGGHRLHAVFLGVRTELDIARSVDKGDVDPIQVVALPTHEAVLTGLTRLGFHLKSSDLERGHIRGSRLPFYQEVEFAPPPHARGRVNELEVTFVTDQQGMEVVFEIDRRGFFSSGDQVNRFRVDHHTAAQQDWGLVLAEHLNRLLGQHLFAAQPAPQTHAQPGYAAPAPQQPAFQQPTFQQPAQQTGYAAPPPPGQAAAYQQPAQPQHQPAQQQHEPAQPQHQPAPTGGLNLSKGAPAAGAAALTGTVTATLSWDTGGQPLDLDGSAVVVDASGRALSEQHVVFYNNHATPDGAVRHGGDDSTRGGAAEEVTIALDALPATADRVRLVVSVDTADATLDRVAGLSARVRDASGAEVAAYSPTERSGTAMVVADLQRSGGGWAFRPVGGGHPGGFAGVLRDAGLGV